MHTLTPAPYGKDEDPLIGSLSIYKNQQLECKIDCSPEIAEEAAGSDGSVSKRNVAWYTLSLSYVAHLLPC